MVPCSREMEDLIESGHKVAPCARPSAHCYYANLVENSARIAPIAKPLVFKGSFSHEAIFAGPKDAKPPRAAPPARRLLS